MIDAKCQYVRQHRCLPVTALELVEFYEANGYAKGERDDARLSRAEGVLAYARSRWVDRPAAGTVSFDTAEHEKAVAEIGRYVDPSALSGRFRCGVSLAELAAFAVVVLTLCQKDGFSSRDKVMEILNEWVEEGHLSSVIDAHKMSAFKKVLVGSGYLAITRQYKKPRGATPGLATCYARGDQGSGHFR
jgi:hypothetical protein